MKKVTYRKECKIRVVGVGGVEVTIPKLVIDRAARSEGQNLEEFVRTHKLVHLFNDFSDFDAAYRFERIKETEEIDLEEEVEPSPASPSKLSAFDELRDKIRIRGR